MLRSTCQFNVSVAYLLLALNCNAAPSLTELEARTGMKGISDSLLSEVNAYGVREDSQYLIDLANNNGPDELGGQKFMMVLLQTVLPGLHFVSDYQITDVEYDDPEAPRSTINEDGTITLKLPSRIGEISYIDMRIGSATNAIIGNLRFKDIQLRPTSTVTLVPRPDGQ